MEKKVTNLLITFVPVTYLIAYVGALSLRWHQFQLLTRTLPHFADGLPTLFCIVTGLASIFAVFQVKNVLKLNAMTKKILDGKAPEDEDRNLAMHIYGRIRLIVTLENIIGFCIGNSMTAILDISKGTVPFVPSRLCITVIEAICMGALVTFYEIYYFDLLFRPYRELLEIHKLQTKRVSHISSKIMLVSFVCLFFMGLNTFTCGYGLLHRDNITSQTDVMKVYLQNGVIAIILNLVEYMVLIYIICREMKSRISDVTGVMQELEKSGDLSRRINISMTDDIGLLTHVQNEFMDKLAITINGMKDHTQVVSSSADVLEPVCKL